MPLLFLAETLGVSVPIPAAQRLSALWVGGRDVVPWVDKSSYRLDDSALTQPGVFTFDITDWLGVVGPYINRLDEVVWQDYYLNAILYHGFVRQIDNNPVANYAVWTITCADISEMYDYSYPVVSDTRPAETTQARILYLLGKYATYSGAASGGYVQSLSGTVQPSSTLANETLRSAIEKALALEPVSPLPGYYMDQHWQTHVFFGQGDTPAPYSLTDTAPDGITSVGYSGLVATQDSTQDVDAIYVYGGTPEGSGLVSAGAQRQPLHIATVTNSESTTADTLNTTGLSELAVRQNVTRVTLVVTGYDGWAKGQSVYLTSAANGFSYTLFWIAGVSMVALSGTGIREYTLTLNSSLPRYSRLIFPGASTGPVPSPPSTESGGGFSAAAGSSGRDTAESVYGGCSFIYLYQLPGGGYPFDPVGGINDTFSRPDQDDWGTATSGQMWTTNLTGSAPITGGRGYLIGTVGSVSGYTVPTAGSLQASFHFDRADMATNYGLRFLSDYSGGLYWGFETIGGTLNIQFKFIGGAEVDIPVTWSTDDYEVRLEWSGDGSAEAKTWEAGGTEPDWQLTASSWAPNSTSVYLTAD